jgi:hypothetical protein
MLNKALLVLGLLGLVGCGSTGPLLEVESRYWAPSLSGQVQAAGGTQTPDAGGPIDLKDDLGMSDRHFTDWRASLATGPNSRLRVGYVSIGYHADRQVGRTLVFDGQTFAAGTRVASDLKLEYWRCGWIWEFLHDPLKRIKLGTLVEAKSMRFDGALTAPGLVPAVTAEKTFSVTLPSVGLALDVDPIPLVDVFAEASGVTAGKYGHGWDGEAGLKLFPMPGLAVSAGYRVLDLEARDDPDFAKLKDTGPFVGVSLRL